MTERGGALIYFAKVPTPGKVKTRLQPDLSPAPAARLYEAFVYDTLSRTSALKGITRLLGCDPDRDHPFFQRLADRFGLIRFNQTGNDLGSRMKNAFREARRRGFGAAVIIGTDSPTLPVEYLREAFRRLRKSRLVLGPSTDGGYYLIGVKGPIPPIFNGILWGGREVFSQTLDRLVRRGLQAELLPFWYDIDTTEDLHFLSAHIAFLERAGRSSPAPHTSRMLRVLKQERHGRPNSP